jgi:hypothetical protein
MAGFCLHEMPLQAYKKALKAADAWPEALPDYFRSSRVVPAPDRLAGRRRFAEWLQEEDEWFLHPYRETRIYDDNCPGEFKGYIIGFEVHSHWGSLPEEIDPANLMVSRRTWKRLERFLIRHDLPANPPKYYLTLHVSY